MSFLKLNSEQIFFLNALADVTGKTAKDCIVDNSTISFLVSQKNMPAVIGKQGSNIKKLSRKIRKKVHVFEFDEDPKKFIEKAFNGLQVTKISLIEKDGEKTAKVNLTGQGRLLLLSNPKRLRTIKEIMKRNYNGLDIRI